MKKIGIVFFVMIWAVLPSQYLSAQHSDELNQKLSNLHQQIQFSTSRIATIKKDQVINQEIINNTKRLLYLIKIGL